MTLIEIMLVVVIMGMIAAAVGVYAVGAGDDANKRIAATSAKALVGVAEAYLMQNPGAECPSIAELRASRLLRAGTTPQDPWGTDFQIACGDEVNVLSAGPDHEYGTEDDIAAFNAELGSELP
jgi:general secretion pathway protein G